MQCACDDSIASAPCALAESHVVAVAQSGSVGGLALVAGGAGATAWWTDDRGLFARPLDAGGGAAGPARRVGTGCSGGLAVASVGRRVAVACGTRADPQRGRDGSIAIAWARPDGVLTRWQVLDRSGVDTDGLALAARDGTLTVAWRDANGAHPEIWSADVVDDGERELGPRLLSSPSRSAGSPSAIAWADRSVIAWAETWSDGAFDTRGEVLIDDGRGAARPVAQTTFEDPHPILLRRDPGLLVGFRDARPRDKRPRFFLQRVDSLGQIAGDAVRVGRADGPGGATLLPCAGGITVVAPRFYGRRDVLIGVHRLDAELGRISGEHQLYEFGVTYAGATAACVGSSVLILAAERTGDRDRAARLVTTTLSCKDDDGSEP